jgi:hypothetical protein
VNQRWIKQAKGTYDFDVTKADKPFEFLVKEGRIKLPDGHSMLRPDGVKEKRYYGFHDRNSHSINECKVFRMRIQKAIQEGHLKFDNKMKLDVLTPKFGKESDLWVQLGEKSVQRKEGFFRCIRQKNPRSAVCFRSARKLLS